MSLTRKASSAAKKAIKPPRQDLAAALAERETELAEARRQQAATAEILRVISRSPADAGPVFEAILEACQRLFGSDEIGVYTIGDDDMVRVAAWRGPRAEEVRRDVTPLGDSVTGRIIRERRTHHIPDLRAESDLSALVRERVERLGSASLLYAPMLRDDRGLGSILVARSPPRPFSDREQALLQSFADQAAIAIENARLFNETQEALERQTATARYSQGHREFTDRRAAGIRGHCDERQPVARRLLDRGAEVRRRCDSPGGVYANQPDGGRSPQNVIPSAADRIPPFPARP